MPGLPGNVHHGYDRHVRIVREDNFGECPGAPDWTETPVLGDGFKLKATNPRYFPETNMGGFRRSVGIPHQLVVEGGQTALAWPTTLSFLMHAGLDRDGNDDLYSYCIDHYTPADPRRYLGCAVETLTLRVSGTGDADVQIEAAWRSKLEQENNSLGSGDFSYAAVASVPFMFRDAHIQLATVDVVDVEEFSITVNNNVSQGPMGRTAGVEFGTLAYLIAGGREISLELTKVNRSERLNDAIRSGGVMSFEAEFYHPDGHYFGVQLPVLALEESDETASRTDPTKEAPSFQAITNDAGEDITWGFDEGPTTTTLEPLTTTQGPTTTTVAATTTTTAGL